MSRGIVIAALLALAVPSIAGETGTDEPRFELMSISVPRGDAKAGRQAFVDLQCAVCHRVYGDETLPPPVSAAKGPMLGPSLAKREPGSLVTSIIAPSHSISAGILGDGVTPGAESDLSPMGDFTGIMTVRQMVDLLAYLRSIRDGG